MKQTVTVQSTTDQSSARHNKASSRAARALIVLGSIGVMGLPALAASVGTSAAQNIQAKNQAKGAPAQGTQNQNVPSPQRGQVQSNQPQSNQIRPPLSVSYYSGDPLKGGKLISTLTLTPPQPSQQAQGRQGQRNQTPQAGQAPQNPIQAQAPKGAKYAVIKDPHGGARIIDLAQMDAGIGGRGGPNRQPGDQTNPKATNVI